MHQDSSNNLYYVIDEPSSEDFTPPEKTLNTQIQHPPPPSSNKKVKKSLAQKEECIICAYPYNKSNRMKVACLYCAYEACRLCNETYLLSETIPKCMNPECGREWTRKYISETFTKQFMTQSYKKHREKILFDRERALMPSTQIFVQIHNNINKYEKENNELNLKITELTAKRNINLAKIWRLREHTTYPEIDPNGIIDLDTGDIKSNHDNKRHQNAERVFIRACPDENCRGFLSSVWKCGTCNKWTCPDCHEIKGVERDTEHTCDPNNVATATLLSRDTKPCPNCHTGIYKIDGCDQMWCTACHVAFSWRTGVIEKNIHNPHYYEWMRRNNMTIPRNPLDRVHDVDLCNNPHNLFYAIHDINHTRYKSMVVNLSSETNHLLDLNHIDKLIRNIIHIREVDMANFRINMDYNEISNRYLRVNYISNKIDEKDFMVLLQQREKKANKSREYYNVLEMFTNTTLDIMGRFTDHFRKSGNIEGKILLEIIPLIEYTNECLADISKIYNCSQYKIGPTLGFVKSP